MYFKKIKYGKDGQALKILKIGRLQVKTGLQRVLKIVLRLVANLNQETMQKMAQWNFFLSGLTML